MFQFAVDALVLLLIAFEPKRFSRLNNLSWWITWLAILLFYPFAFVIAGVVALAKFAWAQFIAWRARKKPETPSS